MREKPDPNQAQFEIAKLLGLNLSGESEATAAARIHDLVAEAIHDEPPRESTEKQRSFAESIGVNVSADSVRIASAKIGEALHEQTKAALERLGRSRLENLLLGNLESLGIDGVDTELPQSALAALFKSGKARLTSGTPEDLQRFLGYFDPQGHEPIPLTIR